MIFSSARGLPITLRLRIQRRDQAWRGSRRNAMPKSNFLRKKSKKGGTADFKRPKAKVGKRAPQAASHTDTSFKSKRVKVSAQSILHDLGDGDAITARGQGVQELLIQLRHYSPASKREALVGLKTIADRHRGFVAANFGRLAEASLELAVCADGDVRTALLAFQEAMLACVSIRTFSPFANLYVAYVVSAMTSLDGGIRRDSISLLALLLSRFPGAVAEHAERLAPNYPALLAVEPGAKSQAGREAALRSLVSLFGAVSLRYGGGDGSGYLSGMDEDSCASRSSSGCVRLSWKRGSRRNSALMLCPSASALATPWSNACGGGGKETYGVNTPSKALFATLPRMLERLREVWMEAFAAVPPDIGVMQSVVDVLLAAIAASPAIAGVCCVRVPDGVRGGGHAPFSTPWSSGRSHDGAIGGMEDIGGTEDGVVADSSAWFARFVPLLLEAFPVRPQEGELLLGDAEDERARAIERLNMGLCELVVAACAGPAATAAMGGAPAANGVGEGGDASDWLSPVLAHVHEVLRDGVGRAGPVGPQIPSVLRVLSAATRNEAGGAKGSASWTARRQRLLAAFGDFFESLPPRSEAKLLCARFVCSVTKTLLSSSVTTPRQGAASDPEVAREVRRWLQSLPELLCVWGAEFPASSTVLIRALVEMAKRAPAPSPTLPSGDGKAKVKPSGAIATEEAWALESLALLHSMKPAVLGDFFSGRGFPCLHASAQMDAASLLYHLPSVPACVLSALATVCSEPDMLRDDVRSYVLEVIHHRRRCLSPSAYLGFLVSVLTGASPTKHLGGAKRTARAGSDAVGERGGGGKRQRQGPSSNRGGVSKHGEGREAPPSAVRTLWETVFRRDDVTGAVCNSLAMIGTRGRVLLEALRPTLLQLLRQRSGRGRGEREGAQGGGDGGSGLIMGRLPDEDGMASLLQGQRAAMACVLCCWDGVDVDATSAKLTAEGSADAVSNATDTLAPKSESPLLPLEAPMAAACVQAMKFAGTEDAQDQARGARLLRPVIVLVKRWPSLLPSMLSMIVDAARDVTQEAAGATQIKGGSLRVSGGGIRRLGRFRALEPLLRCLQILVRDPGLQGRLRRRHLGALLETAKALCDILGGSPFQDVVAQLLADVELLGGGLK